MKVNYNKFLDRSLQSKSSKEIVQELRDQRKVSYKRSGVELLTLGISKDAVFISLKEVEEKYEEFKKEVMRMENYMVSYVQKQSSRLLKFAEERRKQLKQQSIDKDSELVKGVMPKFEFSKTRVSNFKRCAQLLLSTIHIKPDEKKIEEMYEEIDRLSAAVADMEKELKTLNELKIRNSLKEKSFSAPEIEPVTEVLDFNELSFPEKSEYVKRRGCDTGFLRIVQDYVMTKDGSYIYVCNSK